MRKLLSLAAVSALSLSLGACATSPYGYGSNPLATVLGVLGASQTGYGYNQYGSGYNSQAFAQAAVNACARTASRYGQVQVRQVAQVGSSTLRVYGYASNGYSARNWDCDFRSDGRITDFDI